MQCVPQPLKGLYGGWAGGFVSPKHTHKTLGTDDNVVAHRAVVHRTAALCRAAWRAPPRAPPRHVEAFLLFNSDFVPIIL